jgi:hypothetical protein
MGRRRGFGKTKKKKLPPFELIDHAAKPQLEPYKLMAQIRKEYHEDIKDAKIALAYQKGLKADVDGHVVLGKCIKASDLQRELVDWDFVILLNHEVWTATEFTKEKKMALLDHELCHAELALDKEGEPKVDASGRKQYRIRKHDIEEFQCIVSRHGLWKRDLERFGETIIKQAQKTLEFPPVAASAGGEVVVQ